MSKEDIKEFASFLKCQELPPSDVERRLFAKIRSELRPSLSQAVLKLFLLNAVGSVATLALCPQYGLSLTETHGLMHYFMQIHPGLCFFACGLLWMIGGQVLARLFLKWDERRVLSHYYWGTGFSFILFSILAFACLGSLTLDMWLLFWIVGASAVVTAFGIRLRAKVNRIEAAAAFYHP